MAEEEEPKKVDTVTPSEPPPPTQLPASEPTEASKDVAEEKSVIPLPPTEEIEKPAESTESAALEKAAEPIEEKSTESSVNREAVLARVETEKRISLVKAWEESEKTKAENKYQLCSPGAYKKLSSIDAWENSKKAALEAELKSIEEKIEKQRAEYVEKMKNRVVLIHKEAEEKKAVVEAKRGEELLKAEEMAAKYRATGTTPKKVLGCF
ncbi:Remorin [Hibiscus syriacus]|uniref:Remorin n=1 Tax=Hibiscus syriacus TaxID=106335 RepID=A0A6A3A1M7_HIBSY|nr:Remorin [Hibiscus syriacus]